MPANFFHKSSKYYNTSKEQEINLSFTVCYGKSNIFFVANREVFITRSLLTKCERVFYASNL